MSFPSIDETLNISVWNEAVKPYKEGIGLNKIVQAEKTTDQSNKVFNKVYPKSVSFSDLRFVRLYQGRKIIYGLLDSGAQVNVIGSAQLKRLEHTLMDYPSLPITGFNQSKAQAASWSTVIMYINGRSFKLIVAEVEHLDLGLVLGLPFFELLQVVPSIHLDFADSKVGPFQLFKGRKYQALELNTICLDSDEQAKVKKALENDCLTIDQFNKVSELLLEYSDLWSGNKIGQTKILKHSIELMHKRPIASRPRRHPAEAAQIIEVELNKMLENGVIRPSKSAYSSEVVLVKKKTDDWRFCIDFRPLNKATVSDKFPLPRIQDLVRAVGNSSYFISLDLRAGYWQIFMDENSIEFTAFRTPRGLFEFIVMPFGLKNAPATFQRCMELVLGDLYLKGVLVYLDDVLIHHTSFEGILALCLCVLKRFREVKLTLNLSKCSFFPTQVKYLGHLISKGQIMPDPQKITALQLIQAPKDRKGIQRLLGFFNYYRQFFPKFSHTAEPITRLLKKTNKFKWGEEQDKALSLLKTNLCSLTLNNPLNSDEYLLETDASDTAIGAILSCRSSDQHPWQPVEFASKTLPEVARRWPVHEREAYAIVWALDKFDCYLRGRSFKCYTDNSSLQWMQNATTGKISRWASRMSEYAIEIYHKSGKKMEHVDFLSRYITPPEPLLAPRMVYSIQLPVIPLPSIEDIVKAQASAIRPVGRGFVTREDITYYRGRIWVPPTQRLEVIEACHQLIPHVHGGQKKTVKAITRVFDWPGIHNDVGTFIHSCLVCQRTRPGIERLQGLFRTHPLEGPFEKIHIDLWSCQANGRTITLFTVIDSFTKWVECVELINKTSEIIVSTLLECWISRFGVPRILVSDQEQVFNGVALKKLAALLGVRHLRSAVYHPEGNALIESFHRHLTRGLSQFSLHTTDPFPFKDALSLTLMAYRASFHSTIDESPAFLTHGCDLRPAADSDWRAIRPGLDQERTKFLTLMRLEILAKANSRALVITDKANEHRLDDHFEVNDLVLLRKSPISRSHHKEELSNKLNPTWSLPYRVIIVLPKGKVAKIRSCLSFNPRKLEEVHIQNARKINGPLTEGQRALWNAIVEKEIERLYESESPLPEIVQRFWSEVDKAQASKSLERLSNKRPQPDSVSCDN